MKTLYIECKMGAAGDMLTAALLELLTESEQEEFLLKMNTLGLDGVKISCEKTEKCGIRGTHMKVEINGEEEGYSHNHGDHNDHHENIHHHHSSMEDIEHIIDQFPISDKVKSDAKAVYGLIAEAESKVHGKNITEIHFHEVGSKDAIADVTAVCLLMEIIGPDRIISSPVHVGSGTVKCAHGILPIPAPATAELLKGLPSYSGNISGELCTPTGAALLRYFADSFGPMPIMATKAVGYGMGTKDFDQANCVRVFLGEAEDKGDTVAMLSCNIDDMTGEAMGFATERLLEAGALDVFTQAVSMKKNRPGILLTVICNEEDKEAMAELIFKHTTTIGIRLTHCERYKLSRRTEKVRTELGEIRKKISEGYGVRREKYEYEDLAYLSKEYDMSIEEIKRRI